MNLWNARPVNRPSRQLDRFPWRRIGGGEGGCEQAKATGMLDGLVVEQQSRPCRALGGSSGGQVLCSSEAQEGVQVILLGAVEGFLETIDTFL
jgi:hypothetical protein